MDKSNFESIDNIIGKGYSQIGEELLNSQKNKIKNLMTMKSVPDEGWDELTLNLFINNLSCMDSNNGLNHIGIGEREGRIFSEIVHRRSYGLVHGIGRSGDVSELQPKAVGSSLLNQLTNSILINFLQSIGLSFIRGLIILPFATGMSLTLSMLTLKGEKPDAKYVIWPRIDQKTCLKSMITANLIPVVIEPIIINDEIQTNLEEIKNKIKELGEENIVCVFSTTSCFSPRGYDNIKEISAICKEFKINHLVNNAYGIFCSKITDILNQSIKNGRIDILVSSTDKNFMVPVGGSIIYSPSEEIVKKIKKNYPGRASMSPILDLFITLMTMGKNKYKSLIKERKENFVKLKEVMVKIASKYNERILEIPNNKISLTMSLTNICKGMSKDEITYLGSLFYSRQVSGIRIVAPSENTTINKYSFKNYGSHAENYPVLPYATFAASIGIEEREIHEFAIKFCEVISSYGKRNKCLDSSISLANTSITVNKSKKKNEKIIILQETKVCDFEIK